MAHYTAPQVTAGPVTRVHAGLNAMISDFSLNETASGSTTIAMFAMPAGARLTGGRVVRGDIGTGGELIEMFVVTNGTNMGTLANSATFNATTGFQGPATGIGLRLTASSQVWIRISNAVGTGTGVTTLRMIVEYLADQRGD